MYMMKVIGEDCSNQQAWSEWLTQGKEALLSGNIPRSIVCGDGDGLFSVESCLQVKKLFEVPDDCFHVVKDAGHLAMLEKPSETNKIIKDFFCNKIPCLRCEDKPDASAKVDESAQS